LSQYLARPYRLKGRKCLSLKFGSTANSETTLRVGSNPACHGP
jgi:hypothetical protein